MSVTEPSGPGAIVTTLTATDDDEANTPNTDLTFLVTSGDPPPGYFTFNGFDLVLTRVSTKI